jgi:membrane-associated phospholipid phosphatase
LPICFGHGFDGPVGNGKIDPLSRIRRWHAAAERLPSRQLRSIMNLLSEISLELTRWLQQTYPQLEPFFALVSDLGEFEIYLAVVTTIIWTINKRFGLVAAFLLTGGELVSTILKQAFRNPRPYWLYPDVGLRIHDRYGLPSGHTQGAAIFCLLAAMWLRRRWVWLLAVLAVIVMSLARIYLGLHDIEDVLVGAAVGLVALGLFYGWDRFFQARFRNRILGQRLLFAAAVTIGLAAVYAGVLLLIGEPDYSVQWAEHIDAAERASLDNATLATAGLLGLSIGYLLEASRIRFLVDGPWWKRLARLVVGGIGVLLIWQGLGRVFPDEPLALALPLRFLRYFLLSLWVTYYGPLLFVRLRLADALAEPEHRLKIS